MCNSFSRRIILAPGCWQGHGVPCPGRPAGRPYTLTCFAGLQERDDRFFLTPLVKVCKHTLF